MNRPDLDSATRAMREDQPEDEVVHASAKRVFRQVFDSVNVSEHVGRIKGCSDFQALIPAYLDNSLRNARVSLLEDHVSKCLDCRRILNQAKAGQRGADPKVEKTIFQPAKKRVAFLPWALATSLAVGTALGVAGAFKGLFPNQHAVRAKVESVEGTLYRVSDFGSSLVEVGAVITNAEELRTAKGSRAIFRLINGARVEMAERSDVSVSRGWSQTSIQVERGHVIVRADPGDKPFRLAAGDLRIPVRNAVLSVDRGTKGSRIAVAKGSAKVEGPEKTFELIAGQQMGTDYRLVNASMTSEFAWSQNADYYLSLLKELSNLQKDLQSIPSPRPRYSSQLAKYLPENTVLYAAIPNVGGTLSEAKSMINQRLAESEVLRDWWQQQPAARNGELETALTQISSIGQYLGDEVVLAIGLVGPHRYSDPVLLAEIHQSGLREYLEQSIPAEVGLRIVSSSTVLSSASPRSLFVSLDNNILIASPNLAELQAVSQAVTKPTAQSFVQSIFFNRIEQSYGTGAEYLLAADMERMITNSVTTSNEVPPGFNNARFLVLERSEKSGDTQTSVSLSFSGARTGIASWLGAPGPLGSLDFVSPDANFASSVVMKSPLTIVKELIGYAAGAGSHSRGQLSDEQRQLIIKLASELAAPLGGDATFAIDGPLLPIPSWKFAIEVYDFARLQQAISSLVDGINQLPERKAGKLQLSMTQVNSRTFYCLRNESMPSLTAYYTFADGYLLAAPNTASLLSAIQNRELGYTLASSSEFRSQLPGDSYTDFSAIVYHNGGKSFGTAAEQLKTSGALSASQQQALAAIMASAGPGLICVYGEPNRIVASSKGSFLGFGLGTLVGIEQGKPVLPLIASGAKSASQPQAALQQRF